MRYRVFFFSSRRRHTRLQGDWSSDVCSSDLGLRGRDLDAEVVERAQARGGRGVEREVEGRLGDVEFRVPGLSLHGLKPKEAALNPTGLLEGRRVRGAVGLQYLALRPGPFGPDV